MCVCACVRWISICVINCDSWTLTILLFNWNGSVVQCMSIKYDIQRFHSISIVFGPETPENEKPYIPCALRLGRCCWCYLMWNYFQNQFVALIHTFETDKETATISTLSNWIDLAFNLNTLCEWHGIVFPISWSFWKLRRFSFSGGGVCSSRIELLRKKNRFARFSRLMCAQTLHLCSEEDGFWNFITRKL